MTNPTTAEVLSKIRTLVDATESGAVRIRLRNPSDPGDASTLAGVNGISGRINLKYAFLSDLEESGYSQDPEKPLLISDGYEYLSVVKDYGAPGGEA